MSNNEFESKIDQIIALEWPMFHAVNGDNTKADCQNDQHMFFGMRRTQFAAWSEAGLNAYLEDLTAAKQNGRNLPEEKYIHMMETTAPENYAVLVQRCPSISEEAKVLVDKITSQLLQETEPLFATYPRVAGRGRPLYATHDALGVISVETYNRGELLTYSEKTLIALYDRIRALAEAGTSYAYLVLENTAHFYGYASLAEAEADLNTRAEAAAERRDQ